MTPLQWAGAGAVAVGLILLVVERFGKTAPEQTAVVKGWKIEASGSVALVLVVVGVLGLWLGDGKPEEIPRDFTTMTTISTTTTTEAPTTTILFPSTMPTISATSIAADSAWVQYDIEYCDDWAIFWFDEDFSVDLWFIQVAAMGPGDTRDVEWEFESFPPLCQWEFAIEDYERYWLWISPIYVTGEYGPPTFIEYVAQGNNETPPGTG